ncbi:hypothetical protein HDV03_003698 [Kappamyces sp. JEL0829]|nr:hypothetical protein HDV03_003698 [Kappamyces sp. JEL0829]
MTEIKIFTKVIKEDPARLQELQAIEKEHWPSLAEKGAEGSGLHLLFKVQRSIRYILVGLHVALMETMPGLVSKAMEKIVAGDAQLLHAQAEKTKSTLAAIYDYLTHSAETLQATLLKEFSTLVWGLAHSRISEGIKEAFVMAEGEIVKTFKLQALKHIKLPEIKPLSRHDLGII